MHDIDGLVSGIIGRAARLCTGLASGHAIRAIDVTTGQPLMKPSQDAQDHARGTEIYHLDADVERGFWTEVRGGKTQCNSNVAARSLFALY